MKENGVDAVKREAFYGSDKTYDDVALHVQKEQKSLPDMIRPRSRRVALRQEREGYLLRVIISFTGLDAGETFVVGFHSRGAAT